MADPSKSSPSFTFNQVSRPDAGAGLFGQPKTSAAGTSNSPFGSAVAAPSTTGGSLFGSTPASSAPSGSLFGAGTSGPAASSPFGGASTSGSMFGAANNTAGGAAFSFGPSATTGASTGGLFGSSQPVSQAGQAAASAPPTSLFSTPSKPAGNPATPQPAANFFGGPSTTLGGEGLFGSKAESKDVNTTPTSKQTPSLFGNSTTPAGPPPGASTGGGNSSLFSFKKPEGSSNAPSSNLFGGGGNPAGDPTSNKSTTSLPFAPPSGSNATESNMQAPQAPAQATNIFGAPPKSSSSGTGLFRSAPPASQSGSQGNLFSTSGQPPEAASGKKEDDKSTSGLFSNVGGAPNSTGQPANSASASSLFANTTKQPLTPSFSFANASGTTAASSGTINAPAPAQSSGLFGQPDTAKVATASSGASAPSTAAPKTNFFPSLSQPQNKPTETTNTVPPSFPAATSSAPDAFSNIGRVSSPSTTAEPHGLSTVAVPGATSTNTTNLGASTTGPAPPARSRLKDKTMDDIITRWASDLSKYQKEFQMQAEKVASWDRMLVENSEKIQRLYGSTLEAERATSEVERQLTSVESDQAELESWLSHYETEVDNMIQNQVGQGDGLSGPDQERERTYQLATRLSDRLDEMGKDLGSMIEEINEASSSLSKHTKSDDPLTQVVRVLNSHLTQLQQIDVGAASLQMKVNEAQRLGQNIGPPNGLNGPSSDAAEGFYRSYMGRG